MPATYEKIATTTLGSTSATITFSTITSAYTDLKIVLVGTTTTGADLRLTFNSDTGTNYSETAIYGTGASAGSERFTSRAYISISNSGMSATIPHLYSFDVFSYAGSTNKTVLGASYEDRNGSGSIREYVGLWRSTAAITTITLTAVSNTFAAGTTATLYGILKA
jgi:hypothetical protein